MTYKLQERKNMPEISAAAYKSLSLFHGNISQPAAQDKQEPLIIACKQCNQMYNQQTLNIILAKISMQSQQLCLNCTKQSIKELKSAKYPALRDMRQDLDEITIVYQTMYNKWKALSKEYQSLDYQENLISHEQKLIEAKKPAIKKPKPQQDQQSATALAMKILKNLSPEMQKIILENLTKQSS